MSENTSEIVRWGNRFTGHQQECYDALKKACGVAPGAQAKLKHGRLRLAWWTTRTVKPCDFKTLTKKCRELDLQYAVPTLFDAQVWVPFAPASVITPLVVRLLKELETDDGAVVAIVDALEELGHTDKRLSVLRDAYANPDLGIMGFDTCMRNLYIARVCSREGWERRAAGKEARHLILSTPGSGWDY